MAPQTPHEQVGPRGTTAVARRRQILVVLLLATVLTGVLVLAGPSLGLAEVSPSWLIAPLGLLGGYIALLAATRGMRAQQADDGLDRRNRSVDTFAEGSGRPAPAVADGHQEAAGSRPSVAEASEPGDALPHEPSATLDDDEADLAARASLPPSAGPLWTPTGVPLPSYVNAPRAASSVRTIDLSANGPWSVENPPEQDSTSSGVADQDSVVGIRRAG